MMSERTRLKRGVHIGSKSTDNMYRVKWRDVPLGPMLGMCKHMTDLILI